jgi:uncharacterized protein
MNGRGAEEVLLLVVLQNVLFAAVVVGGFFFGVLVLRLFGAGAGYSLAPLGFRRPNAGYLAGAGSGFLLGLGAVFISGITNLVTFYVFRQLDLPTQRNTQGPFLRALSDWVAENPTVAIPATVLVVVLFGPAVEELLWRGAVFGGLFRLGGLFRQRPAGEKAGTPGRLSFAFAAVVSSLAFAALHLEPTIIPSLFLLAFLLCVLYARTGSLLPPFVAHATFNSFTVILLISTAAPTLPA